MKKRPEPRPVRVSMVSLGCPKNLVDSEKALGTLASGGLVISPDPADSDVAVVTTCGFIDPAKEESIATILEMVKLKEKGDIRGVVVAGCLVERFADELRKELPEVDAFVPFKDYPRLARLCREVLGEEVPEGADWTADVASVDRVPLSPAYQAYVKVSEGCDNPCSFCTIPAIRGRHISRPFEEIVDEAKRLAGEGVREIVLIGQDTTFYGYEREKRFRLADLLRALDRVDGLRWIRLMYAYPAYVKDELLDAFLECRKVVPYIDMPIQHIADAALKRMGRPLGGPKTRALLARMRERVPGLALRTTFIVGSPGETAEEVEELVEFVREFRFHHAGAFVYSREEDTPMGRMEGQVTAREKNRRRRRVMEAQQRVVLERNRGMVESGAEVDCIVESRAAGGRWHGRTSLDAPGIDGTIRLPDLPGLVPGAMGRARVVSARGYDLEGAWVAAPS
jgi:ribosomal protein S12 methylthiotransferase